MTLAILATGDEIIHGDTLNTNGHEIAKILSSEGVPLGMQLTCSDKEQELLTCIEFLIQHHKIVLSIGGLGPTTDDRTRFAFSTYLGLDLVEHPLAMAHITARLSRANLPLDAGNQLQALFPQCATLLPNPNGTAMGCMFTAQNKLFILLPGPPRECLPMFQDHVLPQLQKTHHSHKQLLSWQLFGVSEGRVAEMLEEALVGIPCNTGYRLDTPYLEFKVRCEASVAAIIQERIDPLVAPHCISLPKQKASQLLRDSLCAESAPVVIIDQATGGVLETLLRCPLNTRVLNFQAHSVQNGLHFEITGLDAFWRSEEDVKVAQVLLTYHNQQYTGFERHEIPYRGSAMVLHYAAEWLSFRILHLINQIHESVG